MEREETLEIDVEMHYAPKILDSGDHRMECLSLPPILPHSTQVEVKSSRALQSDAQEHRALQIVSLVA
jgi:hypothetical protein